MKKTTILAIGLLSALLLAGYLFVWASPEPKITVYKSPTCGCCADWIDHMEANGFEAKVHNVKSTAIVKQKFGIDKNLHSCHTAIVGDYLVEGHVPADLVQRMLNEKPKIKGLAVPGMPQGSPGMETGVKEPYEVLTFSEDKKTSVYARR